MFERHNEGNRLSETTFEFTNVISSERLHNYFPVNQHSVHNGGKGLQWFSKWGLDGASCVRESGGSVG